MYKLRDYQQKASDAAVSFFNNKTKKTNAIMVLPTGSGKSLIIADIAARLEGHTLVFQPSKEILEQNFKKLCSYGILDCSIYSASFNSKEISRITFATIGSVKNHPELFIHFKNIIVDECHLVNPKEGMYKDFFNAVKCKVLGLTATPYRLSSSRDFGSMLKFITRTKPHVFSEVIYHVQVSTLLDMGYLAKLNYYPMNPTGGFGVNEGIIVMAATNRVDILDPAILRPGRFDRKIPVSRPDVKGREEILKVHAKNKPLGDDVDLHQIAQTTAGFTGADLENLLNEAAIVAAKDTRAYIKQEDIRKAFIKVGIGAEKKSRVISEKEKKITAYHEAGHAILFHVLPDVGPVYTVSIIPTGMGAAGYTMPLPERDDMFSTKGKMLQDITVDLGGRAGASSYPAAARPRAPDSNTARAAIPRRESRQSPR